MIRQTMWSVYSLPFEWGRIDCCAAPALVFHRLTGIDPMGSLRGTYDSAAGALRLIAQHGGMQALARAQAAAFGLKAGTGRAGEIGLVKMGDRIDPHAGMTMAFAIHDGAAWNVKTEDGSAALPASAMVECWRA